MNSFIIFAVLASVAVNSQLVSSIGDPILIGNSPWPGHIFAY